MPNVVNAKFCKFRTRICQTQHLKHTHTTNHSVKSIYNFTCNAQSLNSIANNYEIHSIARMIIKKSFDINVSVSLNSVSNDAINDVQKSVLLLFIDIKEYSPPSLDSLLFIYHLTIDKVFTTTEHVLRRFADAMQILWNVKNDCLKFSAVLANFKVL